MLRFTPLRRALAWLVTGPAGHLAAGTTDWVVLVARHWSARLGGRSGGD